MPTPFSSSVLSRTIPPLPATIPLKIHRPTFPGFYWGWRFPSPTSTPSGLRPAITPTPDSPVQVWSHPCGVARHIIEPSHLHMPWVLCTDSLRTRPLPDPIVTACFLLGLIKANVPWRHLAYSAIFILLVRICVQCTHTPTTAVGSWFVFPSDRIFGVAGWQNTRLKSIIASDYFAAIGGGVACCKGISSTLSAPILHRTCLQCPLYRRRRELRPSKPRLGYRRAIAVTS